jgi:hypothetical protein
LGSLFKLVDKSSDFSPNIEGELEKENYIINICFSIIKVPVLELEEILKVSIYLIDEININTVLDK